MLCEECQKNEAAFSVTVTSGGETTTRHLCGECMQKMGLSLNGGEISGFLSSILSILSQSAEEKDNSPVCSGCGMHYSAFERTGRLGCAQCYHDFAEELKPLLQRIHGKWKRLWPVKTLRTRQNIGTSCGRLTSRKKRSRHSKRRRLRCLMRKERSACERL